MIPFAMSEQLYNQITTFVSRVFIAFTYAQASEYMSSIYSTYSNHIRMRSTVVKYLELHSISKDIHKRVSKYHEILWENFKGINEGEILSDLPESINKQVKLALFSGFIEHVTLFPQNDKAAIASLISRLKLNIVAEGEYVIREGEVRDCLYFLLKGSVNIISKGILLATLYQGSVFGEMALAEKKPTVRTASAL